MKFTRGMVVHHKVMGKGVALDVVEDGDERKVKVRMANGHIEEFYPEELETDEEVQRRNRNQIAEINRVNEERGKDLDPYN